MTLDLPGRHASRVHGDDLLVEARKPPLIPGDQLRVERAFPIARNTQAQLGILGQHRLLRIAIAVIGPARRHGRRDGLPVPRSGRARPAVSSARRKAHPWKTPPSDRAPTKSSSNVAFLIAIARLALAHQAALN